MDIEYEIKGKGYEFFNTDSFSKLDLKNNIIYIAEDIDAEAIKEEVIKCVIEIIADHHSFEFIDSEVAENIARPLAETLTVNKFAREMFTRDFYASLYKGVV